MIGLAYVSRYLTLLMRRMSLARHSSIPAISVLERQRQKNKEFKAIRVYMAILSLKMKQSQTKQKSLYIII